MERPAQLGVLFCGDNEETRWTSFEQRAREAFSAPAIVNDLAEYDKSCDTVQKLFSLRVMNKAKVDEVRSRGALITDDAPFTEFFLWRIGFQEGLATMISQGF